MDIIKKFYPKQNDIQTFKVDPQGFRKAINENLPASNFFVKPPVFTEKAKISLKNPEKYDFFVKRTLSTLKLLTNCILIAKYEVFENLEKNKKK